MNSLPPTLESLAVRITALEESDKENHVSHGSIYARIEAVEKGHAVLDNSLTNIWTVLKEIQSDIKDLKAKPGKRWEMVVDKAVEWVVIAALGAAVIFK